MVSFIKVQKMKLLTYLGKSMIQKFERIDPSPNIIYTVTVESMDINSITQVNDNVTKKEDMPMKNASQLDYNIIDETQPGRGYRDLVRQI